MSTPKREITRQDILDIDDYIKIRKEKKTELLEVKKNRRVPIGPYTTLYFENYDTMWSQIHEMLYIERGGEEQIADELSAYDPLVPKGSELVATFMIEINDPVMRARELLRLTNIEEKIYLSLGGHKVYAVPEDDVERTTEDGKTSSIHFLRFPLGSDDMSALRSPDSDVMAGIEHENYGHVAILNNATKEALAKDL
ncbi:DUF3501 family protein [Sneathiella sp. P13V-1]|uniref:DUF3501 family protein n=1 Tax=Sneathiella sp. P13V-1 TaxID=2697366 RepID=UPI00187B958B|nr:DUF3501 family protein [Sneathiella sp. P13V-1]MBE7635873.1 DUF3501 family protein [Sneathiella sp. P13V-1]